VLTIDIDVDQLLGIVRRHAKLAPKAACAISDDLAKRLHSPRIQLLSNVPNCRVKAASDSALSTLAAADLVRVSRPCLVARIEAGDIPLHQQVGAQRRVEQSAVRA